MPSDEILRKMPAHIGRWVSISPDMTIMFEASMTSASVTPRSGPIAAIFVPSIRTSARQKLPSSLSTVMTQPLCSRIRLRLIGCLLGTLVSYYTRSLVIDCLLYNDDTTYHLLEFPVTSR